MKIPELFGVRLPQITKFQLKEKIRKLDKISGKLGNKHVLYFHYSEFILRANRNPWYKDTLNRGDLSVIDGKGLHWAMWSVMGNPVLPLVYGKWIINTPVFLRVPIFIVFFLLQLIINLILGFLTLTLKYNFTRRTKNQVVLGREFVYDLLKIAQEKKWKTLILGGSSESDEVTKNLVTRLFPGINLISWSRSYKSLLMRDQVVPEFVGEVLNSENVCQFFPDLWEAKQFIKDERPELILVCLGGASGRQEFFIDNLYQDPETNFVLATGLGAAVDHLGGGAQQSVSPKWMIDSALEWVHRLINQPYRRGRVIDSIVTLWWWTTVEQFAKHGRARNTVVNIVTNEKKEVLLVKRKNILPGDIGWTFVQGQIESGETPEEAGIRELMEEASFDPVHLKVSHTSQYSTHEQMTTSFLRFLVMGAKFNTCKKFLNFVEYKGNSAPAVNWENQKAEWFDHRQVFDTLSVEKRSDWQKAVEIIKKS